MGNVRDQDLGRYANYTVPSLHCVPSDFTEGSEDTTQGREDKRWISSNQTASTSIARRIERWLQRVVSHRGVILLIAQATLVGM